MNENEAAGGHEIEVASSPSLMLPADAGLAAVADRLVEQACADGVALTGEGGLLTGLIQQVLQGALDAEITDHLGYEPHVVEGGDRGTPATGTTRKRFAPRSATLV